MFLGFRPMIGLKEQIASQTEAAAFWSNDIGISDAVLVPDCFCRCVVIYYIEGLPDDVPVFCIGAARINLDPKGGSVL